MELNTINANFKNEVANKPGGERVLSCYLCGTCTAGCPVSAIDSEYNPRKIMREVLLGMKDEVLSNGEIWKCYQCHTCVAHCPMDVRFADVVRALRELAVESGAATAGLAADVEAADLECRKNRLAKVTALIGR